jgi:hypothetical protein
VFFSDHLIGDGDGDFAGTKADRKLVDRPKTKDSIAVNIPRSLPPKQGNQGAKVTMSMSFSLELGFTMISLVSREIDS